MFTLVDDEDIFYSVLKNMEYKVLDKFLLIN